MLIALDWDSTVFISTLLHINVALDLPKLTEGPIVVSWVKKMLIMMAGTFGSEDNILFQNTQHLSLTFSFN